jgi:hypothetical protein
MLLLQRCDLLMNGKTTRPPWSKVPDPGTARCCCCRSLLHAITNSVATSCSQHRCTAGKLGRTWLLAERLFHRIAAHASGLAT